MTTGSSRGGARRSSSPDPELVAKVTDVVGLYLAAGERRRALRGGKSQIQALDRTAPILPMQPGLPERRTHDDVRHGTTTLFALEIATGKVTGHCQPRHRHQEFLRFLKQVAKAYPDVQLHLVMDNYAAHKRTFRSVKDLNKAIRAFIDGWNDRAHPFVWTNTADEILKKANRQKTATTGH